MAGTRGGYSIVIEAQDRATKTIDAVNKRLAAARAPTERMQKSLARFSDLSGLRSVSNGMQRLAQRGAEAFYSISRLVGPMQVITGAASIAGVYRLATNFAALGSKLDFAAQRMGVTVPQLQGLEGSARLAGAAAGSASSGFQAFRDGLVDMAAGRNPQMLVWLRNFGLDAYTAQGRLKTAGQFLPEVADRIARLRDPTRQAEAAMAMFGSAGEQLLPWLRQGAAGIAKLTTEAQSYGTLTADQIKQAQDLRVAQTQLSLATEGLANTLGAELSPVLTPLLQSLAGWIKQNRSIIAQDVTGHVKPIIRVAGEIAGAIDKAVKATIGWNNALYVLEGLLAVRLGVAMMRFLGVASMFRLGRGLLFGGGAAGAEGAAGGATGGLLGGLLGRLFPLALPLALGGDTPQQGTEEEQRAAREKWNREHGFKTNSQGYTSFWDWLTGAAGGTAPPAAPAQPGASGGWGSWLLHHLNPFGSAHAAERPLAPGRMLPRSSSLPIGLRTRNPLNLMAARGQDYETAADGEHVGVFGSMADGVAAAARQLLRYQDVYHRETVRQIVERWVGHTPPADYVNAIARSLGVSPDAPVNLHDRSKLEAYIRAAAPHESGHVDDADIAAGVGQALGLPGTRESNINGGTGAAGPTPHASGPAGTAQLNIHVTGETDRVRTGVQTAGNIWHGRPRIYTAMPGAQLA